MRCSARSSGGSARRAALAAQFAAALAELDAAVAALPRERVLYLIWKKPWMTVTRGTYIAATLARAGWDASRPRRRALSGARRRRSRVARPDRILLSSEPYAFRERDVREVTPRRGKPVHLVDGEMTSWYGPRAIAGMRYLARLRRDIASGRGASEET